MLKANVKDNCQGQGLIVRGQDQGQGPAVQGQDQGLGTQGQGHGQLASRILDVRRCWADS